MKLEVKDASHQSAINDTLFVLRDKKMFISEKKMWLTAIDLLSRLGYYKSSVNGKEKASLFGRI